MIDISFLLATIIFIAGLLASLLCSEFLKKQLGAFCLNIGANLFYALTMYSSPELTLGEEVYLSEFRIKLSLLALGFNLMILLLNGARNKEKVQSSIFSSFMLLCAIILLGANNFIIFSIAFFIITLTNAILISMSNATNSQATAVAYIVQSTISIGLLILGIAFFYGATGTLSILEFAIDKHSFFLIFLAFFLVSTCFELVIFPFCPWAPDVYSNIDGGNMATVFLLRKFVLGFVMISLFQRFLPAAGNAITELLSNIIICLVIVNSIYGNIIAWRQTSLRKMLAYSLLAHSGHVLLVSILRPNDMYDRQLVFYLAFYMVSITGAFLVLENFAQNGVYFTNRDNYKGILYISGKKTAKLVIFMFGLAGIPLTSAFFAKYLLFISYLREGHLWGGMTLLASSILTIACYTRFISTMLNECSTTVENLKICHHDNAATSFVQLMLIAALLVGGVFPFIYIG